MQGMAFNLQPCPTGKHIVFDGNDCEVCQGQTRIGELLLQLGDALAHAVVETERADKAHMQLNLARIAITELEDDLKANARKAEQERDKADAAVTELVGLLRSLRWTQYIPGQRKHEVAGCPVCWRHRDDERGHKKDCRFAATLEKYDHTTEADPSTTRKKTQ